MLGRGAPGFHHRVGSGLMGIGCAKIARFLPDRRPLENLDCGQQEVLL